MDKFDKLGISLDGIKNILTIQVLGKELHTVLEILEGMGFYNKHNNSTPEPDDILTISIDPHQSMDILLNNGIIIKSQYFEEFYIRYTYKSFMRKVKLERILKNE